MHQAFDEGWLIWSIQPASKRLQGYVGSTLAADFILVLNKDYLDLYRAGQLPPLQALTEWQQLTAIGEPIQTYQRYFWPLLTLLPDWIFREVQKDFIDLAGKQLEKEGAVGPS